MRIEHDEYMMFQDRAHGANLLVEKLLPYRGKSNVVVLGLPRGGVVTASVVAKELHIPWDVLLVEKIQSPFDPELAIGAVAAGGERFVDAQLVDYLHIDDRYIASQTTRLMGEMRKKDRVYHAKVARIPLDHKTVIVVDDGIATGATMRTAIIAVKGKGASRVVVASPVASRALADALSKEADETAFVSVEDDYQAVGQCYEHFFQVSDEAVVELMQAISYQSSAIRQKEV